ncbi:hypothetical protein BGZ80_000150 [Entomortierella chlamydospora]|uniref:Uncharacterized protein n=1 Tax=Entomortierella chlamydospora TaxID=101097 RepID=A0A9P6MTU0_9FUNG|nr:hypothetical protein BGZ80_000150 [Entomortierella chlamydospora]
MSAIDFFEFESFLYKHRKIASQEWIQVVVPIIEKINQKRAKLLRHEWNLKPQIRAKYWDNKRREEEKSSHLTAVQSEGRIQSIASVRSITDETIKGLAPNNLNIRRGKPMADGLGQELENTTRLAGPSIISSTSPLTLGDLETVGECTAQHLPAAEVTVQPDPSEPLIEESDEIAELHATLARSSHVTCEWKVNNDCVACRFQDYQRECINALDQKILKRVDVADVMALIGVFAPFIPTPRMTSVFGRMLDYLQTSVKFPAPHIDDLAIMEAVRQRLNGERDEACETIRSLDRKKRIMFETLLEKLPMKSDKTISEGTFVTNYVSPLIHGTLTFDDERVQVYFPNTECQTQKQQGIKADRPDIVIKFRGQEVLFGEVTGPAQAGHTAKNAWDLFRLARFGKAFLDQGNSVAPLLQIVYNNGSFMRLTIRTRGMFILKEIGAFEVPTKVAAIPTLAATIPTLLAARDDVHRILNGDMNTLKRSWGYGDIPDAKKRLS